MAGIESKAGVSVDIEAGFDALRAAEFPMKANGWFSLGLATGLLTGIAANGAIFAIRNISTKLILLRRFGVGLIVSTPFTTAQRLDVALIAERAPAVARTGGTAVQLLGNNAKHRTSHNTPAGVDIRVSTTAALAGAGAVIDANPLALQSTLAGAAQAGILLAPSANNMISHDSGDHPMVLAQNEALILTLPVAMGLAGVATAIINLEFAEADSFGA